MMTMHTWTAWVCEDCLMAHSGYDTSESGYVPDREPMALLAGHNFGDVTSGMLWTEHAEDCPNRAAGYPVTECGCEEISFSRATCDGCGSTLAGSRHALTVWEQR